MIESPFSNRYSIIHVEYLGYKFSIPEYPWQALSPFWVDITVAISKVLYYRRFSPEIYKDHKLWREGRMGQEALEFADLLTRDRAFRKSVRDFNAQVPMKYGENWLHPFLKGDSPDYSNLIAQLGQLIYNSVKFLKDAKYLLVYGNLVKVIRPYWCYEEGTETLTANGWKEIANLTPDDVVATRTQDGFLEYQTPTDFIKRFYEGELFRFKSQEIDLGVTPEHRMFCKTPWDKKYDCIEAQNMDKTAYRIPRTCQHHANIPDKIMFGGKEVDFSVYVDFMAAWLAEGWTHNNREVQLGQKNKMTLIRDILAKIPFKVVEKLRQDGMTIFSVYSAKLTKELRKYGTIASNKRIPRQILNADKNTAQRFLDVYVQFDGTIGIDKGKKSMRKRIRTISKGLADDLQELEFKANRVSKIYLRTVNGFRKHQIYDISEKAFTTDIFLKSKHIKKENYKGYVHCITVPNGVFLVRNNGKICWSGNCPPAEWALRRDWGRETVKFIEAHYSAVGKYPSLRAIAQFWRVPRYTLIDAGFTLDVIRDMYRYYRETGEIKIIKPEKEYKRLTEEEQKQMAEKIARRIYH